MDSRDKRSFDEWKQSNSRSRINGAIVTADYTRNPYVARRGLLYSRNYAREPLDLEVSKPGVKCRGEQSTRLLRVATESGRCLILMQRASLLCHAARDCTFLNTNVSFHQKRNPDLHSNVRILSTTISILRTERVGSKPLSLPPSRFLSLDSFSWKRSKCELTASTTGNIFDQKFPRSTSRQKKKSRIVLLKRRGAGLMQDWNVDLFLNDFSFRPPSSGTLGASGRSSRTY